MDAEKLTPAPWWFVPGANCLRAMAVLRDGVGGPFGNAADGEFCAMARTAFDVMMRRGWTAEKTPAGWMVDLWGSCGLLMSGTSAQAMTIEGNDPFTALVEADKWYTANVEKTP